MRSPRPRPIPLAALLLLLAPALLAQPRDIPRESLDLEVAGEPRILEGTITGDGILDFEVAGERSQILSVDLRTSNDSGYFNILPTGSEAAIFIGSTRGHVADVALPETGRYVIRLYLVRAAARRGETMDYSLGVGLGAPEFADGLSGGPDYWKVSGLDGGRTLTLRTGPSTRYEPTGRLANGEVLQNRGCRLTGTERWCSIRAAHSGVTGWVAGQYLRETAPPPAPTVPENGPEGNGVPFDATGTVPCATAAGAPLRPCPFGVVREGPGNAGVWVALGDGAERHLLFEKGVPVAADSADALTFETNERGYVVRVGDERYEIPEAVVFGG